MQQHKFMYFCSNFFFILFLIWPVFSLCGLQFAYKTVCFFIYFFHKPLTAVQACLANFFQACYLKALGFLAIYKRWWFGSFVTTDGLGDLNSWSTSKIPKAEKSLLDRAALSWRRLHAKKI